MKTTSNAPQPGDTLPNGATVIVSLPHPYDPALCYVAAEIGGFHPYATWLCHMADRSTCWGHYVADKVAVLRDVAERSAGL